MNTIATALFLALAVSQVDSAGLVIAIVAAAVLVAVAAMRSAGLVTAETIGVNAEARELFEMPEPSHPSTAGRPRTRAPSMAALAA